MSIIRYFVPCIPPQATAQQKGVFVVNGKPRFFTKDKVAEAGNELCALLFNGKPQDFVPIGPVSVRIILLFPFRKADPKRDRALLVVPHDTKPDVDNLTKMLLDAMTRIAFWTDDSVVSDLSVRKARSVVTGIFVEVQEIEPLAEAWRNEIIAEIPELQKLQEAKPPADDLFLADFQRTPSFLEDIP